MKVIPLIALVLNLGVIISLAGHSHVVVEGKIPLGASCRRKETIIYY